MVDGSIAPRVAVAHDLSGVGRCALSVALPALSALGAQACPLPTALLSAHMAFPGVSPLDTTAFLRGALETWSRLGRAFEAVYTGFLASPDQAKLLSRFIEHQRGGALSWAVVDPAMADHGRLYRGVSPDMPRAMRELAAAADLITPNRTEACLLTDTPYGEHGMSDAQIARLLSNLAALTRGAALVTGLQLADGGWANALMRGGEQGFFLCRYDRLDAAFPGTGDLLASVVTGFLLRGDAPETAMARATSFVRRVIARTLALGTPPIEGVQFEGELCALGATEPLPLDFIVLQP